MNGVWSSRKRQAEIIFKLGRRFILHIPISLVFFSYMKNPTSEQVAAIFGASVENVKRQYAKNALQLRGMAEKAGSREYRGKTAVEWNGLAVIAEGKSK